MFNECFPNSEKVYREVVHEPTGSVLRAPFRRVHLEDEEEGCTFIDLYDTSGPQGIAPQDAPRDFPKIRAEWVKRREDRGDKVWIHASLPVFNWFVYLAMDYEEHDSIAACISSLSCKVVPYGRTR